MSSAAAKHRLTTEQYLAIERKSEVKHEYDRGRIIAMAGASREHNLIALNVGGSLNIQLRERPCEAYQADMRVKVDGDRYVYPDVVVACGDPQFEDDQLDILLNPTLIVEVLSPSTEDRDRREKYDQSLAIDSLQEYLMIAQDEIRVEHHSRRDGAWDTVVATDRDATIRLGSIGCALSVREVYAKVKFPEGHRD